jgi:central kinetochore subunit Mis15/CHL4
MAPRNPVRAPTNASVPDTLRVPSIAKSLVKSLIRLSKPSLIDLALHWLLEENQAACAPYLASNRNLEEEVDEDYLWSPADTVEELRLMYNRMRFEPSINKRYIVDRILDGDWRRGLSLYQVASIDSQCLSENDKALRWTALKLVSQSDDEETEQGPLKKKRKMNPAPYPTTSPSTFLRNLQRDISPLVKAHYHLHRLPAPHDLSIIRICVADSPYANPQSIAQSPLLFTDPSRIIFIALPDSCPYVYVSVSGAAKDSASTTKKKSMSARTDTTALKRTVLEGIPKALSKSQHRYALESTSLTARSLSAMITLRGNSGTNAANGVYTVFAKGVVDNSPIDAEKPTFAHKIIHACEDKENQESNLSLSELSLKSQQQTEQLTALVERSNDPVLTRSSKAEEDRLNLKIAAATRFGLTGLSQTNLAPVEQEPKATTDSLDRLQIRLDENLYSQSGHMFLGTSCLDRLEVDPFDQTLSMETTSEFMYRKGSARMTLTFQGSNVFLGLRQLVESGVVKAEKLPAWMTGEEAISGGTVRHGAVVCGKGGGT